MSLTYIFHSCFVLETEKSILIFDYWLDLNGVVPTFLKKDKPVYVFSSHFLKDNGIKTQEYVGEYSSDTTKELGVSNHEVSALTIFLRIIEWITANY